MARTKNSTKNAAKTGTTEPARGRKTQRNAQETAPAAPVEILSTHERLLREKYPLVNMVANSWRPAGERDGHGRKCTVICVCPCGAETVRATSDLWQCGSHCPTCRKDVIRNRKAKKEEAK
jgi:hypothetical protein